MYVYIPSLLTLAVLLLLFLLVSRAYLRQPPSSPATDRIAMFVRLARAHPRFQRICQVLCRTTGPEWQAFDALLAAALAAHSRRGGRAGGPAFPEGEGGEPPMLLMRLGYLRGGWIGFHPWHGRYALGLADYGLVGVSVAVTIHELFHLMRHVQRHATFEEEAAARGWRLLRLSAREEGLVWWKTWWAVPGSSAVIVMTVLLTLFTAAWALHALIYFIMNPPAGG